MLGVGKFGIRSQGDSITLSVESNGKFLAIGREDLIDDRVGALRWSGGKSGRDKGKKCDGCSEETHGRYVDRCGA